MKFVSLLIDVHKSYLLRPEECVSMDVQSHGISPRGNGIIEYDREKRTAQ